MAHHDANHSIPRNLRSTPTLQGVEEEVRGVLEVVEGEVEETMARAEERTTLCFGC